MDKPNHPLDYLPPSQDKPPFATKRQILTIALILIIFAWCAFIMIAYPMGG
jgi:hypothetical protein